MGFVQQYLEIWRMLSLWLVWPNREWLMGSYVLSGNGVRVCVHVCVYICMYAYVCVCIFCWARQCYWCWLLWEEAKEINMQTQSSLLVLASEKYFSCRLIKIHIHPMQIDKGASMTQVINCILAFLCNSSAFPRFWRELPDARASGESAGAFLLQAEALATCQANPAGF